MVISARGIFRPCRAAMTVAVGALLVLGACTTPVRVEQVPPRAAQREATSNVISTGRLSDATLIWLHQQDMTAYYEAEPVRAMALMHQRLTSDETDPDPLFALAETSFRQAENGGGRPYYLAAAIYAFAFIFPDDPAHRPGAFDPRLNTARGIYNRGLVGALASEDRTRVELASGRHALPFGAIDIEFDRSGTRWGDTTLTGFIPTGDLVVSGLSNHYRQSGIGAPLAASTRRDADDAGFQVAPALKAPVTALLDIELHPGDLAAGRLRGRLSVYPAFDPSAVALHGQSVPLEVDTTAAIAYSLSDPRVWASEIAGFRQGGLFARGRPQLVGMTPYQPGKIPVVFIHGTASSAGRWGDMINDLMADPAIEEHFQFWAFSYATGNPVPYSALQLHEALTAGLARLDPGGRDPALNHTVLIGHSQGGLLAKFQVVDTGPRLWEAMSTRPLDSLNLSDQTRELVRRAVFVKPVPQVTRTIFIATPHRGSFVAGSTLGDLAARFVTLPFNLVSGLADILDDNPDALRFRSRAFGSVWSMSPDNPGLQAVAAMPVAPGVAADSIIPVLGPGPPDGQDDGVVEYRSAHLEGVESELVIHNAGHSVQSNPLAIAEVRRLLLVHLAKSCPRGCTPATTAP
jgi:hypothetical protein